MGNWRDFGSDYWLFPLTDWASDRHQVTETQIPPGSVHDGLALHMPEMRVALDIGATEG